MEVFGEKTAAARDIIEIMEIENHLTFGGTWIMNAVVRDVHSPRRDFEKGARSRKGKCHANVPTVLKQ